MFSISKEQIGHYFLFKIKNEGTDEFFTFFPEYGASMNQLALRDIKGILRTLLYESLDEHQLLSEGRTMYKGAKLFPFPNRIKDGSYSFHGRNYQLLINEVEEGHAHHGLVFKSPFDIVEEYISEAEGSVTLEHLFDKGNPGYPFQVKLQIVFTLNAQGFTCTTKVKNEDQVSIPFSDGWHPYFQLDTSIMDTALRFYGLEEIEVDDRMIPTGRINPNRSYLTIQKLGTQHIDTCFRLQKEEGEDLFQIELLSDQQEGRVNIWLTPPYRYLHIYTPPARNCLALEPMTSPADVFNNKLDLIVLEPGGISELVWGITLA